MTHDEFQQLEDANRDLVEALGQLSDNIDVSPAFLTRVMAQADSLPIPSRGWLSWLPACSGMPVRRLALAALLVLAVIGAVPQYTTWLNAYVLGVPASTIHEAMLQERLWLKNFACATQLNRSSSNYAAITGEQVVVVAWACPSGDVLVTIESSADDRAARRSVWVPLDGEWRTASVLDLLVPEAFAQHQRGTLVAGATPVVSVLCQKWLPNKLIQRRVQYADGRCYDEIINSRTGQVIKRSPAPCDRNC